MAFEPRGTRYKTLYVIAILSALTLTGVNLAAPKAFPAMTGVVERGVDEPGGQRYPGL